MQTTEHLFSYGTLQYKQVQLKTFNRELDGHQDHLSGYRLSQLTITDPDVLQTSGNDTHPIIKHTGNPADHVTGMVFQISSDELAQVDKYEVDDYKRVEVTLDSGIKAWAYVDKISIAQV